MRFAIIITPAGKIVGGTLSTFADLRVLAFEGERPVRLPRRLCRRRWYESSSSTAGRLLRWTRGQATDLDRENPPRTPADSGYVKWAERPETLVRLVQAGPA